ncbi:MAG: hypothetical protein U0836_13665 [Pirellulales bacterium]
MNLSRATLQQSAWVCLALGFSFAFVNFFIRQAVPFWVMFVPFAAANALNGAYEKRCQWDAREVS